jgi:hypothetical protein
MYRTATSARPNATTKAQSTPIIFKKNLTTAIFSSANSPAGSAPAIQGINLEGRRPRLPMNSRGRLFSLRQPLLGCCQSSPGSLEKPF